MCGIKLNDNYSHLDLQTFLFCTENENDAHFGSVEHFVVEADYLNEQARLRSQFAAGVVAMRSVPGHEHVCIWRNQRRILTTGKIRDEPAGRKPASDCAYK